MAQDSSRPDFWDTRYRNRVTPWDAGRVPDNLARFAATHAGERRVLIPGCGSSYEARHLVQLGWSVTAIDFSAPAVAAARQTLGAFAACAVEADFFHYAAGAPWPVIYERAFLCALPRRLWPDYAARVAELLAPGGVLAGYFYFDDNERGPPFGASPAELDALLAPDLELIDDRAVTDSIPVFQGKERWQIWRRR
ncbi:MAG: methyltransferase [Pseudomonadota bacterium]